VRKLDVVTRLFGRDRSPTQVGREHQRHLASVYASLCGRSEVVRFLLESRVDVSAQDGHGQSALHYAALGGYVDMIKLLIARGAPLELKNVWGGTVLGQATWGVMNEKAGPDYVGVIQTLLEAGAMVEEADYPTGDAHIEDMLRRHGAHSD